MDVMTLISKCDRAMATTLRYRFIQTSIEKGIAIQSLRGHGYDGTAMDDNGSKELADLKKLIHFVSLSLLSW